MQRDLLRVLLFCFRPALSGLFLAVLAPIGPANAGEAAARNPAVLWLQLPADGGGAGSSQFPADFGRLAEFGLSPWEADEAAPWRGLFFRAGDGLRIGAQGSLDPGSGDLRAVITLKLDF